MILYGWTPGEAYLLVLDRFYVA